MANTVLILERPEAEALVRTFRFSSNGELLTSLPPIAFGDSSTSMLPMDCDVLAMCLCGRDSRADCYPFYGGFHGQYYTTVVVVGEVSTSKATSIAHRALLELYKDAIIELGLLEALKPKEATKILDRAVGLRTSESVLTKLSVASWVEAVHNHRCSLHGAEQQIMTNLLQAKMIVVPSDIGIIPPVVSWSEDRRALRLVPVKLPNKVLPLSAVAPTFDDLYTSLGYHEPEGEVAVVTNPTKIRCIFGDNRSIILRPINGHSATTKAPECYLSLANMLDNIIENKGNLDLLKRLSKIYAKAFKNLSDILIGSKRGRNRTSSERYLRDFESLEQSICAKPDNETLFGLWPTRKAEMTADARQYLGGVSAEFLKFVEVLGIPNAIGTLLYLGIPEPDILSTLKINLEEYVANPASYDRYTEYSLVLGAL